MPKKDLLTIDNLTLSEINNILDEAFLFSSDFKDWNFSKSRLVANLFFEPSTRDRKSVV